MECDPAWIWLRLLRWGFGLFFALVLARIVVDLIDQKMREIHSQIVAAKDRAWSDADLPKPFGDQARVIGHVECLAFWMFAVCEISGLAGGIATYVALKMVAGWNTISATSQPGQEITEEEKQHQLRFWRFNAILKSLVSVSLGVAGGLISSGKMMQIIMR